MWSSVNLIGHKLTNWLPSAVVCVKCLCVGGGDMMAL